MCFKSPPFVYLNVCNESHPFELVPHHPVWTLALALLVEKWRQLDALVGGDLNTNYCWYTCANIHTYKCWKAMHKSMSMWVTKWRLGMLTQTSRDAVYTQLKTRTYMHTHRYKKYVHIRVSFEWKIVAYARVCQSPIAVFDACQAQFASCQS